MSNSDLQLIRYQNGELWIDGVAVSTIAATHGTPCFIYAWRQIEQNWQAYDSAFGSQPHLVCYAVKANSNLTILKQLAALGSGFDIVSGGELIRVLQAGGDPTRIVFSGVGKQADEMRAALEAGIRMFNVESVPELELLNLVAGTTGRKAPIALRINPDVDAGTHPYISTGLRENKFGVPIAQAAKVCERLHELPHIELQGLACHIGSQLTELAPFTEAVRQIAGLADELSGAGHAINQLDLGGGLGIRYDHETPPSRAAYVAALCAAAGPGRTILIEPGRSLVGEAGLLVTRVNYLKEGEGRHFAIVDAAMTELMRPALYNAWQRIEPIAQRPDLTTTTYDVVGPVCETGDFLGKGRALAIRPGDLLAIRDTGAYGFTMSSNYNSRPRVPEILVRDHQAMLIRRRETVSELMAAELELAGESD